MSLVTTVLTNPEIPDFKQHIRQSEALKLKLDLNKLRLDIIMDSTLWNPFKKDILIEWKYALVVSYDWICWYVLSFDETDNWIIIKQLQGASSKVSYKINTTLNSINFYLDFFKQNLIWKFWKFEISETPTWLENIWEFVNSNPFIRYTIFKRKLDKLINC